MQIKTGPTERNMFAFLLSFVSKHIFYWFQILTSLRYN
jgi:hypothetical protein